MVPIKVYDFEPRNLPKEILESIGLIVANAAQTENITKQAIAGCLGIDMEYGGALTTHMTAPLRFDVLKAVAEIKLDEVDDLDELDALLENCKAGFAERNRIAHCSWCRDPSDNLTFIIEESARETYAMKMTAIDAGKLKQEADYIYWAGLDLYEFLSRNDLLPDYPPSDRQRDHKSKATRKKSRAERIKRQKKKK